MGLLPRWWLGCCVMKQSGVTTCSWTGQKEMASSKGQVVVIMTMRLRQTGTSTKKMMWRSQGAMGIRWWKDLVIRMSQLMPWRMIFMPLTSSGTLKTFFWHIHFPFLDHMMCHLVSSNAWQSNCLESHRCLNWQQTWSKWLCLILPMVERLLYQINLTLFSHSKRLAQQHFQTL